ncbi:MAG: protease HtpX [Elusimicrobia bacterium RIFOXYD2_FULL_34_15]|nr:MAG: protease HtpX [Elusimicrobia bacterium RIFOXYD2_FULL_34_15]
MNGIKTFLLMLTMMFLFILIGNAIGGRQGMITAFIFAAVMNFIMYWFSDKIVLAMYRAKPVSENDAPEIYKIVRNLTVKGNIPMPKIYILPMETPNAFATGRNPDHAAVAVTKGILDILDDNELEGVIAHELSHITHRDILVATIAATMAGAISMLARMAQFAAIFGGGSRDDRDRNGGGLGLLIMAIIAPIAALLIQLAISRSREYGADEGGAKLSGEPLSLASALRKLENYSKKIPSHVEPATAHMFIVNPLRGDSLLKLFSTHPPVEERIKKLEKLAEMKIPKVIY